MLTETAPRRACQRLCREVAETDWHGFSGWAAGVQRWTEESGLLLDFESGIGSSMQQALVIVRYWCSDVQARIVLTCYRLS